MAKRKLPSTRMYMAKDRQRQAIKRGQRRTRAATKEALRNTRKQLIETRKLIKRTGAAAKTGASINRREQRRAVARQYRAMIKIEKALGTYRPLSKQLTRSRKAAARKAWAKTEKLLRRILSPIHMSTPRRRSKLAGKPQAGRVRRRNRISDRRFQFALRSMRQGKSVSEAAKEIGISHERLARQLESTGAAHKRGGRWQVRDDLPRRIPIFSDGRALTITVANRKAASAASAYMAAVGRFVNSNETDELAVFNSGYVVDVSGEKFVFETDPDTLHRLTSAGGDPFESFYRIVI